MGLSRRQFTREFKLAAVRRLEQGISIAEVARGLEVNPNVLHPVASGISCRAGATSFPATESSVGQKAGLRNWNGRLGSRPLRSIF